jgi:hypothetical protein
MIGPAADGRGYRGKFEIKFWQYMMDENGKVPIDK